MNIQKVLLKVWRAIRDFVARCIDSSVARESKKASCAALRLNASKNAFIKSSKNASRKACGSCTSRALLSLFVASATLLATFVIAPTSALSAGENAGVSDGANTVSTKKVEGAKSDSAKTDGEKKQQTKQSEPNNTEPDKKNTGSSSTLTSNKESKPVEKQPTASNNGVDKAKSDSDVKKNVKNKDTANKLRREKREMSSTRAAAGSVTLPQECKDAGITELAKCYVADYNFTDAKGRKKPKIKISKTGESHTIKPEFHRVTSINKKNGKPIIGKTDVSNDVKKLIKSFSLERLSIENTALEQNDVTNDFVKVNPTSGEITIHSNKWLNKGSYYVYVKVEYNDENNSTFTHTEYCTNSCKSLYSKSLRFNIEIQYGGSENNSLSLKVYNNKDSKTGKEVNDNGTAATVESDKDGKFNKQITPIFIDSQSSGESYHIYHRMVCHKDGDGAEDSDYYLNSINGLTLSDGADGASSSAKSSTQKQWSYTFGNRLDGKSSDDISASTVYEDDTFAERSQSWITGTPKEAGTFTCKVLALKDIKVSSNDKIGSHTFVSVFDKKINESSSASSDGTKTLKQNLFDKNINVDYIFRAPSKQDNDVAGSFDNPYGIFEAGIYERKKVWDVKTIKIVVKSKKKQQFDVKDGDLTLKVYPFKNSDGSLPAELSSSNNKISAILGMSLKPFVDATSAADSKNKITLRVLCSKGEKKKDNAGGGGASTGGAGSSGGNTVGGSTSSTQSGLQPAQPSESTQSAEDPEYKTWSSNLAELGLSVPADDNQNTCHSNKEGETTCVSSDPSKKVAARTDKEVSIKPTEVGDYQCVVFALKPKALTEFDRLTGDTTQSGILTPTSISSKLTSAKPTAFKENKDFAAFTLNIHLVSNFTLPHTGGQSWNLQLGILAALLVNLLAAGFVVSQSERGRKLILGRWRGLCNHV